MKKLIQQIRVQAKVIYNDWTKSDPYYTICRVSAQGSLIYISTTTEENHTFVLLKIEDFLKNSDKANLLSSLKGRIVIQTLDVRQAKSYASRLRRYLKKFEVRYKVCQ